MFLGVNSNLTVQKMVEDFLHIFSYELWFFSISVPQKIELSIIPVFCDVWPWNYEVFWSASYTYCAHCMWRHLKQPTSIGRWNKSSDQSYQQDEVQRGGGGFPLVSAQRQWNSTYWRRGKKGLRSNGLKLPWQTCLHKRTSWRSSKSLQYWDQEGAVKARESIEHPTSVRWTRIS